MPDIRRYRWPIRAAGPAVRALVVLAVAGCAAGGPAAPATPAGSGGGPGPSRPASLTAGQLRDALLTTINGQPPAAPVEAGAYGSLAQVKAAETAMSGVLVRPSACARVTVTGFGLRSFAAVPATISTFRVGGNGISEMLLAPPPAAVARALGPQIPAGCARYTATVNGHAFVYLAGEQAVRHLGQAARAMHIRAAGAASLDIWSVVYRGRDFIGVVTIAGPGASADAVTALAAQAYAHAAGTLH